MQAVLEPFEVRRSKLQLALGVCVPCVFFVAWFAGVDGLPPVIFNVFVLGIVLPIFFTALIFAATNPALILVRGQHICFRHRLFPFFRRETSIPLTSIREVSTSVVEERHERIVLQLSETAAKEVLTGKHVLLLAGPNCFAYETGNLEVGAETISRLLKQQVR